MGDRLRPLLDDGTRVYAYFKHEDEPLAPAYAHRVLGANSRGPHAS